MIFKIADEFGIKSFPAALLRASLALIRLYIFWRVPFLAAIFANKFCLLFAFMIISLRFTPMGSVERNLACCTLEFVVAILRMGMVRNPTSPLG